VTWTVKTLLTIVKSAPYGREDAFAGLRFSLSQIAAGMLERCDTLLVEDGVYNTLKGQRARAIQMPSNLDAVQDLLDMDARVLCMREHLEERGIPPESVLPGIEFVSASELPALVEDYDAFTTY